MNEVLLIVLTWLPVVAESGLLVILAKVFKKLLKEHFSIPEKIVKENKELRGDIVNLNKGLMNLSEENRALKEEIRKLILEMRGIKSHESIKKN